MCVGVWGGGGEGDSICFMPWAAIKNIRDRERERESKNEGLLSYIPSQRHETKTQKKRTTTNYQECGGSVCVCVCVCVCDSVSDIRCGKGKGMRNVSSA